MNDLLDGLLAPSAAGIAAGGWMLCLPICCCPASFGQMVEEIAAARKANNHISTTIFLQPLFSLGTKALYCT